MSGQRFVVGKRQARVRHSHFCCLPGSGQPYWFKSSRRCAGQPAVGSCRHRRLGDRMRGKIRSQRLEAFASSDP